VEARSPGLGRGCEFRVRLPLCKSAPPSAASTAETDRKLSAGVSAGFAILLVEDNVAAAATMADVLEMWGYEVRVAHSGVTALDGVFAACPDVVLLDIGLPGMDGYEVARRLRATPEMSRALMIALTGYGQDADRERSREAGFDYHLTKPVDLDELRRIIISGRPANGLS
jgi:CheY-like chemotaxis protein